MSARTRRGYWRTATVFLLLLFGAIGLYIASPAIADLILPFLQHASTPGQCTVVKTSCHGERTGINADHERMYRFLALRGGCSGDTEPIDDLVYNATWDAGRCGAVAAVPDDCADRFSSSWCEEMRSALPAVRDR